MVHLVRVPFSGGVPGFGMGPCSCAGLPLWVTLCDIDTTIAHWSCLPNPHWMGVRAEASLRHCPGALRRLVRRRVAGIAGDAAGRRLSGACALMTSMTK